VLDRLRNTLRSSREGHSARRQVESELLALQGALNHALRAHDPVLLTRLPDTPQWDRYEAQLARGRKTRTLNLGPAYDAYRSLRRAAREAEESAGRPIAELPESAQQRLWSQAQSTRTALQDAIARAAPLPAQAGLRGARYD
jgi:hypothetical protein